MESNSQTAPTIAEVVARIADDMKVLTKNEVALARHEIDASAKRAAADAVGVLLAGIVALIGFGLACVALVVALEPVISELWVRLVLMAAVYLIAGGAIGTVFAKRLKIEPELPRTIGEAKRTAKAVGEELSA